MPIQIFESHVPDPLDDAEFLQTIDHVVVFADEKATAGESDAKVLVDLVACRHHVNQIKDSERRFTVVAELRRRSSRYVADVRLADDLLVNDSLMASAAVQLAFTPALEPIFMALLSIDEPVELVTRHINKLIQILSEKLGRTLLLGSPEKQARLHLDSGASSMTSQKLSSIQSVLSFYNRKMKLSCCHNEAKVRPQ